MQACAPTSSSPRSWGLRAGASLVTAFVCFADAAAHSGTTLPPRPVVRESSGGATLTSRRAATGASHASDRDDAGERLRKIEVSCAYPVCKHTTTCVCVRMHKCVCMHISTQTHTLKHIGRSGGRPQRSSAHWTRK